MTRRHTPRPFRPAWWLPGAHAQTIGGRFLRPSRRVPLLRERLDTPDGDFLDLDFGPPPDGAAPDRIAVVLHGLEGCTASGYMTRAFVELAERGVQAVGLNFRSCGGEMNRAARTYHAGDTDDLAFVLEVLARRFPDARFGAVGFSLGGNVLLKYLGERGPEAARRLDAAAAVSVPFDLGAGAEKLERGMGRVYTRYFMRRLLAKARAKEALLGGVCDPARVRVARTLRQFDDAATAPAHGFRDAADYYRRSSCAGYLPGIRVPTLLLHSADDPFLPRAFIPERAVRENPLLTAAFTPAGGHVGFVGGTPWAPEFWAEREAADFLAAHLGAAARG